MSNTEIVVVGAGVAGLSAALAVAGTGHDVTLVTKAELVESNTYHAQGGIAAAIFSDDDPKLHAADTMAAGHGLCDPKAVDILTREGAERVREFAAAGVHFDRDAHGHMLRGLEAAHSRARVVHAGGDATGKVFELDVSAMVRKNPRIHIIENAFLKDLIVRGGHIAGVHLLIDGQDKDLAADRVILAAGGAGRMYPYTTNPPVATADGLAVAWRAGAQVADLEFYQFHPTAMAVGEHFLVSEAVRGEGAVLLDEHGHRYMKDIDPRAELAPRDVVARENFRVMQAQGGKPVMLDVSPMARENPDLASFLAHRFPTIDAYTRSLGFDWSKEPIPVAPAAHYYMGGIRTDLNARTSIPGLYAAGECARTGVMGSNRLASNSLLEGLVYGRRAGLAAVADGDDAVWAPEPFLNSAMVRKNPRIHIIENAFLKDLIVRGGHIAGVHLLIDGQDKDLAADRVILAAGGAGRMYPYTTNPPVATADGLAVAWRAGAQVADLEFYQFHPTAMAVGEHFLVSEAVRGEGAVLLDEHGHRYMKDIDPRAELAPRDVVARENFRVMQAQGGKPVMLDVSPMARENPDLASFLAHRFPTIDAYTRSLGFDWSKEPIPVAPAAHYYMGGIRTDLNARTSIPGLYAAGECARTGVMGSNRLASNSLLEGLVYGRRAGLAAVADGDDAVWAPEPFLNSATGAVFDHAPIALAAPAATAAADDTAADKVWNRTRIQNTMWHGVGVLRDEAGLKTAIAELGQGLAAANAQADVNADGAASSVEALENRNMLTVGYVAATAALARTESRGAHARTDHSEPVDNWAHSVAYIKD